MEKFTETYGPIFRIKFGSFDTIVIADYEMIRQAFRNPDLSRRPNLPLFKLAYEGAIGKSFYKLIRRYTKIASIYLVNLFSQVW